MTVFHKRTGLPAFETAGFKSQVVDAWDGLGGLLVPLPGPLWQPAGFWKAGGAAVRGGPTGCREGQEAARLPGSTQEKARCKSGLSLS